MDSLMCNCTSKLAPSARPGMTNVRRDRLRIVMRGLDPRIHPLNQKRPDEMDRRDKPGYDEARTGHGRA
jgi:hypothetical protein